mgnify:CR=1 FL=1
MKLLKSVKETKTNMTYEFDIVSSWYGNEYIECLKVLRVFKRTYVIDNQINTWNKSITYAHRIDHTRKLKHELIFIIEWDNNDIPTYYYELSKYKMD